MNNLFYYLDGANKKGPFTKEEIINLHLPESTWVYGDAMDKWKPLSEVTELHIKTVPEEKPIDKIETIQVDTDNKSIIQANRMKDLPVKQVVLLSLKVLCSLAFITMCIFNIIWSSRVMNTISKSIAKKDIINLPHSLSIIGIAVLLGITVLAFAIFTKSIISTLHNDKK